MTQSITERNGAMAHAVDRTPKTRAIMFENGNVARAVSAGARLTPEALLAALGLTTPRPVILVIGGAGTLDPAVEARLERLLERGAVNAAADTGATLVDGGTDSGVMAALGRAAAASDASVPIVGVAPVGRVTFPDDERRASEGRTDLEPNHTHFLLANSSEWGGETPLLFEAVDLLAGDETVIAILAGGGPVAIDEVRSAADRSIPIVVLEGTGGLADTLAAGAGPASPAPTRDALAQVADHTDVIVVGVDAKPRDLERLVMRLLGPDETLRDAWRQQKLVSEIARREQRAFRFMQSLMLLLGLGLTFLVVAQTVLAGAGLLAGLPPLSGAFYIAILAIPITIAALTAAAGRRRPGYRWIMLRGSSEAIKREIFRYRVRAGMYSRAETRKTPREVKLAKAVGSAMGSLMRTDVNQLAFDPAPPTRAKTSDKLPVRAPSAAAAEPRDNPMSPLTPAGYVKHRIEAQLSWYLAKAAALERQARWLRWLAIAFGAAGTFLAAVGFQIWVAVTTALVGVFATIVESWQLETSVTFYNQAATDLAAIRSWWRALPPSQQNSQKTIDRLVEQAERIIRAEHVGWVQEMQDAMTQFRLEESDDKQASRERQEGDADEPEDIESRRASRQATGTSRQH